jgi:ABC-type proline/glycine betaine transport system permease subunit
MSMNAAGAPADEVEAHVSAQRAAPGTHRVRESLDWLRHHYLTPIVLVIICLLLYFWVHSMTLDATEHSSFKSSIPSSIWIHLELAVVSAAIACFVAISSGILLTRGKARFLEPIVLNLGNLGQAIPSIGLLVLLAFVTGLGFWTATIALAAYVVLPMMRNTVVGIRQVQPSTVDAARGMGMSKFRVLTSIELPIAVPVILAGIRTALVLCFATATLAEFINVHTLGGMIVTGLKLNRDVLVVVGGGLTLVVALAIDWLAGLTEDLLRPRGI